MPLANTLSTTNARRSPAGGGRSPASSTRISANARTAGAPWDQTPRAIYGAAFDRPRP